MKRKLLFTSLALLPLVGAGIPAWLFHRRAAREWDDCLARQTSQVAEIRARSGARDPLLGPVQDGDAWDDYIAAVDRIKTMDARSLAFIEAESRRPWDPARRPGSRAAEALESSRPILALLRDGARRRTARLAPDPFLEVAGDLPRIPIRSAANLLILASREAPAADGRLPDLLACLQLAADTARAPRMVNTMFGLLVADFALDELRGLLPLLSADAVAALETALLELDTQLPSVSQSLAFESVRLRHRFIACLDRPEELNLPDRSRLSAYGYTYRRLLADVSRQYDAYVDISRGAEVEAWPAAGFPETGDRAGFGIAVPSWMEGERELRGLRARVRLLAAAAAVRRGRTPGGEGWPDDPFTLKPLRWRDEPERLVIWSSSASGDAGGIGSWAPAGTGDIVLVVSR